MTSTTETISSMLETTKLSDGPDERADKSWNDFCEFNKTMTLSYMFEHEPFALLPSAYARPRPKYGLFPPRFVFGCPRVSVEDDIALARRLNVIDAEVKVTAKNILQINRLTMDELNSVCGLDQFRHRIEMKTIRSRDAGVAYVLKDTYTPILGVPNEKMEDVVKKMKELTGKDAAWYVAYDENMPNDYSIPVHFYRPYA